MVATTSNFSNAAGALVDSMPAGFTHSWEKTLAADSGKKALNGLDMGYFTSTSSTDPPGSDRAIRAINIKNRASSVASVLVGGDYGRATLLGPGHDVTLSVGRLGAVFVENPDLEEDATIEITFVADDE